MALGFQKTVNQYSAPADAGDFASLNPMQALPAPAGGFVASGVIKIGNFVWVDADAGTASNTGIGLGVPDGIACKPNASSFIKIWGTEYAAIVENGFPLIFLERVIFMLRHTLQRRRKVMQRLQEYRKGALNLPRRALLWQII